MFDLLLLILFVLIEYLKYFFESFIQTKLTVLTLERPMIDACDLDLGMLEDLVIDFFWVYKARDFCVYLIGL